MNFFVHIYGLVKLVNQIFIKLLLILLLKKLLMMILFVENQ